MALKTRFKLSLISTLTTPADMRVPTDALDYPVDVLLSTGIAAGQADRRFSDTRTLVASATEDLDLAGSLLDGLGGTAAFAKIKGLIVKAADANTNNVILGAAAANPWTALLGATGTLVVKPGFTLALFGSEADAAGYPVVAGTGDLLKVANSAGGTPVTYDIHVIGTSA